MIHSKAILFLFVLLLYFSINTIGQKHQFYFEHITTEDGLSQNSVSSILKDKNGYMWFGTENGLNRYDGYEFHVFRHLKEDSTSISGNWITFLMQDSDGYLWAATSSNGINRYIPESGNFERFDFGVLGLKSNASSYLFEDSNRNIWIGTSGGGIIKLTPDLKQFHHYKNDSSNPKSPGSNSVTSIFQDKEGYIWFGSNNGFLIRYDSKTDDFSNFQYDKNYRGQIDSYVIGRTYYDGENIWIGTENGIYIYNITTNTTQHLSKGENSINNDAITGINEGEDGKIWIITDHGGINLYDPVTKSFEYIISDKYDSRSLSNNQAYSFYIDDEGNYWIGNYNGGINIYFQGKNRFKYFTPGTENENTLSHASVLSFAEDDEGKIWIGTDGGGLNIYDPKTHNFDHFFHEPNNPKSISSNVILSIIKDSSGEMWFGTFLGGLNKFNKKDKTFKRFYHKPSNPKSLSHNSVWRMAIASDTSLWLGTSHGMNVINTKTHEIGKFKPKTSENEIINSCQVFSMYKPKNPFLWIGTSGDGVFLYEEKTGHLRNFQNNPADKNSLYNNQINNITQDCNGSVWLGTFGGLSKFNRLTGEFFNYTIKDGLPDDIISSMVLDNSCYLWIGTGKGLGRINPINNKIKVYDTSDGLTSNEFNYNAAFKSTSGDLYFGSAKGFVCVNPDSLEENFLTPKVVLTGFYLFNKLIKPNDKNNVLKKAIDYCQEISLTYKQSVFTVKYAGLYFKNPSKVHYAYKLEGFDQQWNYVKNERKATYTNLDPGKYILKIKAKHVNQEWTEKTKEIVINIIPPFWKTVWFKTIGALFIAISLYVLYSFRVRYFKRQKKLLEEMVNNRTIELKEANNLLQDQNEEIIQRNEEILMQKEEINSQNEELERHKHHLEDLVTERTHELETAKQKAEESDKLKSSFLANISHEIRTPLNAIVGFSTLLTQRGLTERDKLVSIDAIQSSSETLLMLIDDILDLALIETNHITLDISTFNLNRFVNNIYESYKSSVKDGVDFSIQNRAEEQELYINTDEKRVRQILNNFISNAIKFTEKGFIKFGVFYEKRKISFYVKDSGIGIKKEQLNTIFDRFRKLDDDKSKLYRGAGLGLSISKSISDLLGGEIYVESNLGEGSVFYFTLPENAISLHTHTTNDQTKNIKLQNWENKTVLVAEDEITNYKYLEKVLNLTKTKVFHARNGKEAVNLFEKENKIDLILMDIKMPIMTGYEALEIIKEINPEQIVVAQTAYARPEEINKIKQSSFDFYLQKPIKQATLLEVLAKYLND